MREREREREKREREREQREREREREKRERERRERKSDGEGKSGAVSGHPWGGQSEERRETEERGAPGVSSLLDAELVWQMELSVWLSA